jgi:hypothetical protein
LADGTSGKGGMNMSIDALTNVESLTDLETRGFVHIRGFLSADEVRLLQDDHARTTLDANGNFNSKSPSAEVMAALTPRFDDVLRQVRATTSVRADVYVPDTSVYFAVGSAAGVNFPWHQDHESFFIVQNHFDYVNFYMPIVKPDPAKSNVCIIPFDVLKREAPKAHDFLVGNGAGHFVPVAGRWLATNDERGGVRVINADLEALAVTPQLAVGDLLLMRGDIVHRTQDADTSRVALSWRAASGSTVVRRDRLAAGGVRKAQMMRRHTEPYQKMINAFDSAHKDEMPLAELLDIYCTAPRPAPMAPRAFSRLLFREKRRAHTLGNYVASFPKTASMRGLHFAQQCSHHLGVARQRLTRHHR